MAKRKKARKEVEKISEFTGRRCAIEHRQQILRSSLFKEETRTSCNELNIHSARRMCTNDTKVVNIRWTSDEEDNCSSSLKEHPASVRDPGK